MRCAWQAYLSILPHWMRCEVDKLGRDSLEELRLRIGLPPELIFANGSATLTKLVSNEDLLFVVNAASAYSPWSAATIRQGFITAQGGHRIGICGQCTVTDGKMQGIRTPTSLCIRVARDFCGVSGTADKLHGSVLIIGPPGSGKTTLLRDLIRKKSDCEQGSVAVIDEREELFPQWKGQACFPAGKRTDIISGCKKSEGIEAALRCMNPNWIAVDEITAAADCEAMLHAGWCGVGLLATAHAASVHDLRTRPVYRPLLQYDLFSMVLVLHRDKSWTLERIHV